MIIPPEKFATSSIRSSPWMDRICRLLSSAIQAADAGTFISQHVSRDADKLIIQGQQYDLESFERIILVGAGKAVVPMAAAVADIIGSKISTGFVITKDGYYSDTFRLLERRIRVVEAGHPLPDHRNVAATLDLLASIGQLNRSDLVICLISGGGSALLTKPSGSLSLRDIQETTSLLLNCGASINELNIVRKHLDDVKGGGLVKYLYPATVITLILSDVIGDRLDLVASGPTVPDPTTYTDAQAVLARHHLLGKIPPRVDSHLAAGADGDLPDTLKPGDRYFENVRNILVGNNSQVVAATVRAVNDLGFHANLLPIILSGEASQMGRTLVEYISKIPPGENIDQPSCFITGGETTVTVRGNGRGGRNQELALGAVAALSGPKPMLLVSLATDGGDGPTDAAGAVATNNSLAMGHEIGLNPDDYLQNNDSYTYFDHLGDLIKIGPTFTNLNDLVFIFVG